MIAPRRPTMTSREAQERITSLEARNQTLERQMQTMEALCDAQAEELDKLRSARSPADGLAPDAMTLLTSIQVEVKSLRRGLAPLIAIGERVHAREPAPDDLDDDKDMPVSRWQRLKCRLSGHEPHMADFSHEHQGPYTRCARCQRVYKRHVDEMS